MGASGALKVLSTVDPATLCSSNRMEIIPQSDFNILTKIMPRNAKDMDVHYCAFWGKVHLFAQKCTFGAGEKRRKRLVGGFTRNLQKNLPGRRANFFKKCFFLCKHAPLWSGTHSRDPGATRRAARRPPPTPPSTSSPYFVFSSNPLVQIL